MTLSPHDRSVVLDKVADRLAEELLRTSAIEDLIIVPLATACWALGGISKPTARKRLPVVRLGRSHGVRLSDLKSVFSSGGSNSSKGGA